MIGMTSELSLAKIATLLGVELRGETERTVSGINTLQDAKENEISFLTNPRYKKYLSKTRAAAVLMTPAHASDFEGTALISDNPYLSYARLSAHFKIFEPNIPQIHSSAVLDDSVSVGNDVYIGPNVVIEAGASVGDGCYIEANCFVGRRSVLGAGSRLAANVTLYHGVTIGLRALVHSGCVIGADGFGIAPKADGSWEKVHQLGGVSIGDDVEIGACTTIDRGALQDTIIGNGVKLDNQIQIGHNAVVGDNTVMAARAGLAGSAKVGRNCIFGGDACVVGHVTVCDGVQLTARTLVTKSISEPGSYSSGSTPLMATVDWRKNSVRIAHLDKLAKRVGKLERENQTTE